MLKIRLFEEQVNDLYPGAKMPGLAHLYIGEEAVAVGVCEALRRDDYITSTHRGHGHCSPKARRSISMFAELLGKEAGYCRAKAVRCISPIRTPAISARMPLSAAAPASPRAPRLSAKCADSDQVAVCFFGDGALGQGLLYEVMNMASLWKLPVIYVCENNLYNEYTHYSRDHCGRSDLSRASFWHSQRIRRRTGCESRSRHGYEVRRAVRAAATGRRFCCATPTAFTATTSATSSAPITAQGRKRKSGKRERDPIKLLADWLRKNKMADGKALAMIEQELTREMKAAVEFALNAKYPDPDEVQQHVYA